MSDQAGLSNEAVITHLRNRRATYFFGDHGPLLPVGTAARWRLTLADPRGWHANMVGFVEGPADKLGGVLDTAINWFSGYGTDTWVDADEHTSLYHHPELLDERGFKLSDNWDAMICRNLIPPATASRIALHPVQTEAGIRLAAWIAEQNEHEQPLARESAAVDRRQRRYWREFCEWHSRFIIATIDDEPVGTARLSDEEVPLVIGVATLPTARRQGVATAMTAALVEYALAQYGICALYAERDSQAAQIYRRLGFAPVFHTQAWARYHRTRRSAR